MKLYKLTDQDDRTKGGCQWGENITVETDGKGGLCSAGFTHWYTHPLLAVLLNPIHGSYDLDTAHLWEGEGEVTKNDTGLKVGCVKATTTKRIELPAVTREQRVRFAIACVWQVCKEKRWRKWAQGWIEGTDRSGAASSASYASASASYAASAAYYASSAASYAAKAASSASSSASAYVNLVAIVEWAITDSVDIPEDLNN